MGVQGAARVFHAVSTFHPRTHPVRVQMDGFLLLYAPQGSPGMKTSVVRVWKGNGRPLATFEVKGDGYDIDIHTFRETGWVDDFCEQLRTRAVERLGFSMSFN